MPGRIKIVFWVFILAWLAFGTRLFYWQVINSGKLLSLAKQQQQVIKETAGQRGQIITADNFTLAFSTKKYRLFLRPDLVKGSLEELYRQIESFTSIGYENFLEIAKNLKIKWYPLGDKIDSQTVNKFPAEKFPELVFEPQWAREYPESSMAAHLLGFVGSDETGGEKGYYGLEGYYDRQLRGRAGKRFWEGDLFGRSILIGNDEEKLPQAGQNLSLNLNHSLQYLVEKQLKRGVEKYQAVSGLAIIMDPSTGGILGMGSFPSYNPLDFTKVSKDLFSNPAVTDGFEPGSIFKPLVMASAVDLNLVKPETICDACGGPVQINEYSIKTWNEKYYPQSTMTEVIQHSDNTGMVFVARKLGVKNLYHYLKDFGFGELTGIDLEEESSPKLRRENEWGEIDLATAGFGQGIAVTPIQLIRAVAAIANGGKLVTPKLVEKIIENGNEVTLKVKSSPRILQEQTTKILTEMMVNAVEKGEAKWAKPKGYKIAGKTGTAQIPVAGHYDNEKTIASFVGFAPADKPKFVMLVILREPKTSPWGSETAAPLWFEIAKEIFRVWGIPPS